MLASIVKSPEVLRIDSMTPAEQLMYCSLVIGVFRDFDDHGVVLVDDQRVVLKAMFKYVEQWPIKYRKRMQILLQQMNKHRRFVRISSSPNGLHTCGRQVCTTVRDLVASSQPDLCFGPERCLDCAAYGQFAGAYLTPSTYGLVSPMIPGSPGRSLIFRKGLQPRADFEMLVLRTTLPYTRTVKLLDRYIGRHIRYEMRKTGTPQVRQDYGASLEWIVSTFRSSCPSNSLRVEILTGMEVKQLSAVKLRSCISALSNFAAALSAKYSVTIDVVVKKEEKGAELEHERYMITDQSAFQIGRGFDLLDANGHLRDVQVNVARDAVAVYRENMTLPDA